MRRLSAKSSFHLCVIFEFEANKYNIDSWHLVFGVLVVNVCVISEIRQQSSYRIISVKLL